MEDNHTLSENRPKSSREETGSKLGDSPITTDNHTENVEVTELANGFTSVSLISPSNGPSTPKQTFLQQIRVNCEL